MLGICISFQTLDGLGGRGTALPACGHSVWSVCGTCRGPRSQVPECSAGAAGAGFFSAGALVVESERGKGQVVLEQRCQQRDACVYLSPCKVTQRLKGLLLGRPMEDFWLQGGGWDSGGTVGGEGLESGHVL